MSDLDIIAKIVPFFAPELRPVMPNIVKAMATIEKVRPIIELIMPQLQKVGAELAPLMPEIVEALETLAKVDAIVNPPKK